MGVFRAALAHGYTRDVLIIQAEGEALRSGLSLVADSGIKDVEVEVDSLRLVNMLKCSVASKSYLG